MMYQQALEAQRRALVRSWRSSGWVRSEALLAAFDAVPREEFVLPELQQQAYEDQPLPILRGKTISQPSTTMLMTDALSVEQGMKVLEIGAGSGYQSALLALLVGEKGKVFSMEVLPELVAFARRNLERIAFKNVVVVEGDGSQGLPEEAPFDRIIVTAACPKIPEPLLNQLKDGGVLVAPVGKLEVQAMVRATKSNSAVVEQRFDEFVFSPLVGKYGFEERL